MAPEIRNAVIEAAFIGLEGHGIPCLAITLDYGNGSHQGIGAYQAVGPTGGVPAWAEAVFELLDVAGVSEWDKLARQPVRAWIENDRLVKIGHYLHDRWWDPQLIYQKYEHPR